MRLLIFSFLASSLAGQTIVGTGIQLRPPGGGGPAAILMYELKANGSNFVGLLAPNSIATSFSLTLPNTPSAGPGGTYWNLCADSTQILTWCSTTGAGSFIDTSTNQVGLGGDKQTIGIWNFDNGIGVGALAGGLEMGSTSYINFGVSDYMVIENSFVRSKNSAANTGFILGGFRGIGPVANWSGRFDLYKYDGTTLKAGIGHLDSDAWDSYNGYLVAGVSIVDGSRNAAFVNLSSSSTATVNNLTITGTCTGCPAASNVLTQTTNQLTGNTGNKILNGIWEFAGATTYTKQLIPSLTTSYSLGDINHKWSDFYTLRASIGFTAGSSNLINEYVGSVMSSFWTDTGGNTGVFIYAGANSVNNKSVVRVSDAGVFIAEMTGENGFDTSIPYRYNGTNGANFSCPPGQTVRNTTVQGGIITNGVCGI